MILFLTREAVSFVIPLFGKEMRRMRDDGMAYLSLFYFIPIERMPDRLAEKPYERSEK